MSGKKASEVNQLLRNGKKTRSGSVNMLNSSYTNAVTASEEYVRAIIEAQSQKSKLSFSMDIAKNEFPDAAMKLESDMQEIERELAGLTKSSEMNSLESEYKSINSAYEDTDRKAEKVSKDLQNKICSQGRNDPWYCDDEYYAAERVADEYTDLKRRVNSLNARLSSEANRCEKAAAKVNKLVQQAERLISEGNALERKAAEAAKLRADSKKAKQSVTSDLDAIDTGIANKFFASEYETICKEVSSFQSATDAEAVKGFSALTSKIKELSAAIDKKYAEYLKMQSATKAYLDNISKRLNNNVFSDPMSDFSPNGSRNMGLTAFLDEFCMGKFSSDINSMLEEAESLYKAEKFHDADEKLDSLTVLIDSASEHAAAEHEKRKMTIENSIAIRDTMLKLNYDVSSRIITNSDGSFGGFDISCTAGDEKILFENVLVDDEGKFGFGIDHTESVSGTCSSSWHNIRNGLAENGVYVKDIIKNGRSIHAPNAAARSVSGNQTVASSGK